MSQRRRLAGMYLLVCSIWQGACAPARQGKTEMNYFSGKDAALQRAIDADDAAGVEQAVRQGANVNAKGLHEVNPLEWALGHFDKNAYKKLLELKANPNQRDVEQDNAMTLAVRAYKKDPDYLKLALAAGGNPNTRRPDGEPILVRFVNDHDCAAMRLMRDAGADINARDRSRRPLIIHASLSVDWDSVWCLLELGAKYDYPNEHFPLSGAFDDPRVTLPDSPLYPYKVKCYNFLKARGVKLPDLATGK